MIPRARLRLILLLLLASTPLHVLANPTATLAAPRERGPTRMEFSASHVPSRTPACPARSIAYPSEAQRLDIRSDLDNGKFDQLEGKLVALHDAYARSQCSDLPFTTIILDLSDGGSAMQARYDAWIAAKANSPYAYTARGNFYWIHAAYARGTASDERTSRLRISSMQRFLDRAKSDFEAALSHDPRFTEAMAGMLTAVTMGSDVRNLTSTYQKFLVQAPHSYVLDTAMIAGLAPRWKAGGADPLQFAKKKSAKSAGHTDENLLTSYAHCLAADDFVADENVASARAELRAGMVVPADTDISCYAEQGMVERAVGDHAAAIKAFALYRSKGGATTNAKEADSWLQLKQYEKAITLFTEGLRFRTQSPGLLCGRAEAEMDLGKIEQARRDVNAGLASDPGRAYCLDIDERLVHRVRGY